MVSEDKKRLQQNTQETGFQVQKAVSTDQENISFCVELRKGPLLSPSQGGGGASSEKLGFELCLATLGGGAAFHEAAADKKLQVEIFLDLIKCVA